MDKKFERLMHHENCKVELGDVQAQVNHGVFLPDPELTHSTGILLAHLPDVNGRVVADIGCGAGVIAISCAKKGAKKVIASDVSVDAIRNTLQNIDTHALQSIIEVRHSDLFQNIPEKFDYIFANLPILDELWGGSDDAVKQMLFRFFPEALEQLFPGGSIFLPWGSFADIHPIKTWLQEHAITYLELQEERLGYTWTLFQIMKS